MRCAVRLFCPPYPYHTLRVWLDALTPKQLLFFEYMARRLEPDHQVLFTARSGMGVEALAKIRGLRPVFIGEYGGGSLSGKLVSHLDRARDLVDTVQKFSPNIAINSGSPDAARVSFGLQIPHVGFSNTPHAEAVCRLYVPLLNRLLIPWYIRKDAFSKYGIGQDRITQYKALDEVAIVRNRPAVWDAAAAGLQDGKKTILFRTYESEAAYIQHHTDMASILDSLSTGMPDCNIVVVCRYRQQADQLRTINGIIILDKPVDSGALLSHCDILIGSGGTMTTEAVLRGVPTISYEPIPNITEQYLVQNGYVIRAKGADNILRTVQQMIHQDVEPYRKRARAFVSSMDDPYDTLVRYIND